MSEQLTKPFIVTITFVALTAIMIAITSEVTSFNYTPATDEMPEGWEWIGGFNINWWENEDDLLTGYDVDPTDTEVNDLSDYSGYSTETWYLENYEDWEDFYRFWSPYDADAPTIRVWIIRNNSDYDPGSTEWWKLAEDFFLITRQTQDWPFCNVRKAVIPFEDVFTSDISDNATYVMCKLGNLNNVTLFLNASSDLEEALEYNFNYTIRLGTPFGAEMATTTMMSALGQILTLRLPGTHPVVDLLLAIPLWAGIGFLAITLVSRFIPLVGGG